MVLSVLTIKVSRASPTLLNVSFAYDESLVALVKSIPGRKWNDVLRLWQIPASVDNFDLLRSRVPRFARLVADSDLVAELEEQRQALARARDIRLAGDATIAFPFLTQPYAHQRAGLAFLAELGSGALFWEMGLGKTKTAIDYAEWLSGRAGSPRPPAIPPFKVLVICPNTVKRNWAAEIEKHAGHNDYVIPSGSLVQRAGMFRGSGRYVIVNCELLSYKVTADALKAIEWDLVIVDESTRFKSPKASRTKALHKLRRRRGIILTGTPITGQPADAWSQLEFVSPGIFGTFTAFRDRYLEIDFFKKPVGIKPHARQELTDKIAARSYRIQKAEVLDLPPKVYTERRVELEGDQATAYQQMKRDLRVEIEGNPRLTASNILTMLLRLTQITAGLIGEGDTYNWLRNNAKVVELDDLLNDELRGEQVVIFGQYQKELEHLAARYVRDFDASQVGRARPLQPIIYGPTPEPVRHQLVTEFQAGDRRLLFCQIRTGGIGINLTAAQTAIYFTRSWSLEEWLQSQDRLHRIGQRGTVSIVSLVAAGTVDDQISKALAEKQDVADHLTGDAARKLAAQVLGD
jgi:SNF2 family DNA or RNA helicase